MGRMFQIIAKDWYKRRSPTGAEIKPVHVSIPDYKATHNHICNMIVTFSDRSTKTLIARVLFNELTNQWTVDGMEVAVTVIENYDEQHGADKKVG